MPGKARSSQERDALLSFRHDLSSREEFPALFEKAKQAMGLDILGSRAFSEDILRVEVSGPTQPQLTVVDLPGLIHSENKKQSAYDVSLVHKLVESYMKNERSIILAVVSAMNEFANQIVLKKARTVDPNGQRTIGVITKPDTLREGTTLEREFLALARNEDVRFERGWHVVKNLDLGAGEGETKDRDSEESLFFDRSSFKSLPASSVGISSLRHRLSQVLFDQVRSELPKLIKDIVSGSAAARDGLDKLGPSRMTAEEQRAFLIRVGQDFQILSKDAINGQYSDPFFQDQLATQRRLCAVIANLHDNFRTNLHAKGARWIVSDGERGKSSKNGRSRYRTREEAIDKVQELLRISRGREVSPSWACGLSPTGTLTTQISFPASSIRCSSARFFESIASPGRTSPGHTSARSGKVPSVSSSSSCSIWSTRRSARRCSASCWTRSWTQSSTWRIRNSMSSLPCTKTTRQR